MSPRELARAPCTARTARARPACPRADHQPSLSWPRASHLSPAHLGPDRRLTTDGSRGAVRAAGGDGSRVRAGRAGAVPTRRASPAAERELERRGAAGEATVRRSRRRRRRRRAASRTGRAGRARRRARTRRARRRASASATIRRRCCSLHATSRRRGSGRRRRERAAWRKACWSACCSARRCARLRRLPRRAAERRDERPTRTGRELDVW